jgi:hypothetical protein
MVESSENDGFVMGLGLGATVLTMAAVSIGRGRYQHYVKSR